MICTMEKEHSQWQMEIRKKVFSKITCLLNKNQLNVYF